MVNALSSRMVVGVKRNGFLHVQEFERGKPVTPLVRKTPARGTGTKISFVPDREIFGPLEFSTETIRERLEIKSFLIAGLKINLKDKKDGTVRTFHYPEGIKDFLNKMIDGREPVGAQPFYCKHQTIFVSK